MVQLTLDDVAAGGALSQEIERHVRRWARGFGGGDHLITASRATGARFATWGARTLTARERARVGSYFDAVARRALASERSKGVCEARRRLVEASIVADLCAGGWTRERACEEARVVMAGARRGAAA